MGLNDKTKKGVNIRVKFSKKRMLLIVPFMASLIIFAFIRPVTAITNPLINANWYVNTNSYSGSGPLLDLSGKGNHAQIGDNSFDPIWNLNQPNDSRTYFLSDGGLDTDVTTPDSPALSVTGDLDIRSRFKPDNWTSEKNFPDAASPGEVISKYDSPVIAPGFKDDESYETGYWGNGLPFFEWNDSITNDEHVMIPDEVNVPKRVGSVVVENRWTLDVDNGSGQHEVDYYEFNESGLGATTTSDGKTWDLKQHWTFAGTTDVIDSTSPIYIGGGPANLVANVYHAEVYDGIDGVLVADFNPDRDAGSGQSWTTPTSGEVWTMTKSGRIIRPTTAVSNDASLRLSPGRYLEVASNQYNSLGFDEDFTIAFSYRPFSLFGQYYAKGAFPTAPLPAVPIAGYGLLTDTVVSDPVIGSAFFASNGVDTMNVDKPGVLTPNIYDKNVVIVRYNKATRTLELLMNGQTDGGTTIGEGMTMSNALPLIFGKSAVTFDFYASAIWNRALTDAEIQSVNSQFAGNAFVGSGTEANETLADTGLNSHLALYFALALIASGVAGVFVLRQQQKLF